MHTDFLKSFWYLLFFPCKMGFDKVYCYKVVVWLEKVEREMVSTQNDKGTFIFKFALCIYLVTMMLDVSMFGYMDLFSKVSKGMRYFAYLLLIWKIIGESSYTPRQLINYAICILISIISYRASGSKLFIFLIDRKSVV